MHRLTAQVLGIIVGLLAIAGLFVEGEHFLDLMNVDLALDIARIVLAAVLLIVGFGPFSAVAARTVLAVVGLMYVLMGLLAFADNTLFGALPTGFTGFDIGFHLVVGVIAVVIALIPARKAPAVAG